MLKTGDKAVDFKVLLDDNSVTNFDTIRQNTPIILFFYPSSASYSKTCQQQAAAYNAALKELGEIKVLGVSTGSLAELQEFKRKFAVNFPVGLITKDVQAVYGAREHGFFSSLLGWFKDSIAAKRVTFIIDAQGIIKERIDLPTIANGPAMTQHAKDVVEKIQSYFPAQPPQNTRPTDWAEWIQTSKPLTATQQQAL